MLILLRAHLLRIILAKSAQVRLNFAQFNHAKLRILSQLPSIVLLKNQKCSHIGV